MAFFCPFTKRLRTDDRTRFFLRRLGFQLTESKRSAGYQVPVLVDPSLLAHQLHCPSPAAGATSREPMNGLANETAHRLGVSQPYRRLVRNALGETYVDLLALHGPVSGVGHHEGNPLQRAPRTSRSATDSVPDALSAFTIAVSGFVEKELGMHLQEETTAAQPWISNFAGMLRPTPNDKSVPSTNETVPVPQLNDDQRSTMELCLNGHNIYIGGNAGTGKSFLLVQLANLLASRGKRVLVTAMTGIAAMNIEGTTLHHALGVTSPPAGEPYRPEAIRGWSVLRNVDVLIVDEVSMLDASLLNAIDAVSRRLRRQDQYFGGVQVILGGDFLQLEPIQANILHAPLFHEAFLALGLRQPMRQRDDLPFLEALNELRIGQLPQCIQESAVLQPVDPTAVHLYPTRRCAQRHNARMMAQLSSPVVVFRTAVRFEEVQRGWTEAVSIRLFAQRPSSTALRQLEALLRSALMSACNVHPDEFAFHCQRDATLSTVTVLLKGRSWGKRLGQETVATMQNALHSVLKHHPSMSRLMPLVTSLPLGRSSRVAMMREALQSIQREPLLGHKELKVGCRVMLIKNLTDTLVNGSLGVVERLAPLADPTTTALMPASMRLQRCSRKRGQVPVVRFDGVDHPVAIPWIIVPSAGDDNAFVRCNFRIMPLMPAYAFTVHKVQGVTLNCSVLLDCERMWPCPHLVYVAASRVRKLSQLRIVNLHKEHVTVSPSALAFSMRLRRASDVAEEMDGQRGATPSKRARTLCGTVEPDCPLID